MRTGFREALAALLVLALYLSVGGPFVIGLLETPSGAGYVALGMTLVVLQALLVDGLVSLVAHLLDRAGRPS